MEFFGLVRVVWIRRTAPEPTEATAETPPPAALTTLAPPSAPEPSPPSEELSISTVLGLISLADDLAVLADRSGEESGSRTLGLLARKVERLLARSGVQVVRDEGPVVGTRHEVVATRPAGSDQVANQIASTVRPGYLHDDGSLIRPQQVVAYTAGEDNPL